jgi:betaine-aldehyde dehydrogenase
VTLNLLAPERELFVGGQFRPPVSGQCVDCENPADETVIRQVGRADAADVEAAVEVAGRAAPSWGEGHWEHRAELLRELARRLRADADRLSRVDTEDSGNPIRGSRADVAAAAKAIEYVAGLGGECGGRSIPAPPGVLAFTRRVPFGVVGRIIPFNHPLLFAAQAVAAPLITGNTVVIKPSDTTALAALELAKLTEGLLPPGVLSVLPGTGPEAGTAIVQHPAIRRIAFTGSLCTGRAILRAAADRVKTVTLELGGKNPLICFPDIDPEAAAVAAVLGMNLTSSSGQSCQSTSRVLVHEKIYDQVVAQIVARFAALRVGPPQDDASDVGPLAHRAHFEKVTGFVDRAVADGAEVAVGGARPGGLEKGYFLAPTVLLGVRPDMEIAQEEVFGPVLSVLRWSDYDEMLRIANGTRYGLTANVLTNDFNTAWRAAAAMRAGVVLINGPVAKPAGTPFGGLKESGLGKESGIQEILSYTEEISVVAKFGM